MIDVLIVGGFLGAGKTTWVANYIDSHDVRSAVIIVNEFADTDVDAGTLDGRASKTGSERSISIAGGCVCCEKLDDLRNALHSVVSGVHGLEENPEGDDRDLVIIETSGLADPGPLIELLTTDPVLMANAVLADVVVVVDAVDGVSQLRHRSLARRQVQAAGRVVVAKVDLVADEHLGVVAGAVLRINPGVAIRVAIDGVESRLTIPVREVEAFDDDGDEELRPAALSVTLPASVSWAEYALWLEAVTRTHPDKFLRTKGTVSTPSGPLVVQSVGSTIVRPQPTNACPSETTMVLIYCGVERERVLASLQTFVAGATATDLTDRSELTPC